MNKNKEETNKQTNKEFQRRLPNWRRIRIRMLRKRWKGKGNEDGNTDGKGMRDRKGDGKEEELPLVISQIAVTYCHIIVSKLIEGEKLNCISDEDI